VSVLLQTKEDAMNGLIMCSLVALNIFSAPAGNTVVGEVPAYQRVYLMDGSLLRDWVFIGKPGEGGVSPRGWVIYSGLGQCQWPTSARIFPGCASPPGFAF
jgi:hypothetical protein